MTVLDTNILVSLLKGERDAIEKIRSLEQIESLSTTVITSYELLKGACISSRPDENLAKVRETISSLRVLELSLVSCEEASKIYKELRERGTMIGEFDILIAAIAMTNGESLLTRDKDFNHVSRLKVVRW